MRSYSQQIFVEESEILYDTTKRATKTEVFEMLNRTLRTSALELFFAICTYAIISLCRFND